VYGLCGVCMYCLLGYVLFVIVCIVCVGMSFDELYATWPSYEIKATVQ